MIRSRWTRLPNRRRRRRPGKRRNPPRLRRTRSISAKIGAVDIGDDVMDEQTCLIDGFGPLPVVRPESVPALEELVRATAADGSALYPVGGQTMVQLGVPPKSRGRAV